MASAQAQAWRSALEAVEAAFSGTADPADPVRREVQGRALARLDVCRAEAPGLDPAERAELEARVRAALSANRLNLKWTRLRAGLARIGAPRAARPAGPRAARLDIVS